MIGTKAFLVQILVVSFALVMGLWALRKSLNSIRGRWSVEAVLLGLFGVFISTMFLLPFILQVRAFSTLKSMKAAEIRSFAVGATVIENRIQIESLVGDLHSAEWFTGMHGGWSNERPARIERSAAPPILFHVGRYPANGSGAVVLGRLPVGRAYWSFDCCFIRNPSPSWFAVTP